MVFTDADRKMIQGIMNTQDKKELVLRMFVSAMMQGTNITAPEMKQCSQLVINSLREDAGASGKISKKSQAV